MPLFDPGYEAHLVAQQENEDDERGLSLVRDDGVLKAVEQAFLASDDDALDHMIDVLTDDQVDALPDPTFVIEGWAPRGFFTDLYGRPGVKKTFALLGMSRSVRRGIDWMGNATEQGAILFYEGEGLAQIKKRRQAWDVQNPMGQGDSLAPGGSLARFVDLTTPKGVSAVIRTVRAFERKHQCAVVMVVFDPLVEFMTGEENGEGMDMATRGCRALAQYLDISVLVGHHSNASGERARGADFLRMRAGALIRMEDLPGDRIGLVQEKQKNAEQRAVIVRSIECEDSIVLECLENLSTHDYMRRREESETQLRSESRSVRRKAESAHKSSEAKDLLLAAIKKHPGLGQTKIVNACLSLGIGRVPLESALDELVTSKAVYRKTSGPTSNAPRRHWIAGTEPSDDAGEP